MRHRHSVYKPKFRVQTFSGREEVERYHPLNTGWQGLSAQTSPPLYHSSFPLQFHICGLISPLPHCSNLDITLQPSSFPSPSHLSFHTSFIELHQHKVWCPTSFLFLPNLTLSPHDPPPQQNTEFFLSSCFFSFWLHQSHHWHSRWTLKGRANRIVKDLSFMQSKDQLKEPRMFRLKRSRLGVVQRDMNAIFKNFKGCHGKEGVDLLGFAPEGRPMSYR